MRMALKNQDILREVFHFIGIDVPNKAKRRTSMARKITKAVFICWLIMCMTWTVVFLSIAGASFLGIKASLPITISPVLMTTMWIILHFKRTNIGVIMEKLPPKSQSHQRLSLLALLFICFAYPVLLSILYNYEVIVLDSEDSFFTMTFSPRELGTYTTVALSTLGLFINNSFKVSFPCLATYLQSVIWWRCRRELMSIRKGLSFFKVRQDPFGLLVLLKRYHSILHTAGATEEAFSTFSLLNLMLHLLNIFSGLSILLLTPPSGPFKLNEILISMGIICSSLTASMTFAAEVPQVARRVEDRLHLLNEKMVLRCGEEQPFLQALLQRETFTFSACGVVYFTRSLILATFGSMLTYSVLIIQFASSGSPEDEK